MKRIVLIALIIIVAASIIIILFSHEGPVRPLRVSKAPVFEDYYTSQSIPFSRFSGGLKGTLDVLMDKALEHRQAGTTEADYLPVILATTSPSGRRSDFIPLQKPWAAVTPVDLYGNSKPVFMVEQYLSEGPENTPVPVTEFIEAGSNGLNFLEYTSAQTGKKGRMAFFRSRSSAWATVSSGRGATLDILQAALLSDTPGAPAAQYTRIYFDGGNWIMLSNAGQASPDSDFNTYFPPESAFPCVPIPVSAAAGVVK